jgi:uncharacterized protein
MSQENIEVVRAVYYAWNAGDMDAVRELHDPAVVQRAPEGWPEPGPFVGREAVMRQFERLRETWDNDILEPIGEFIDAADRVVVRYRWSGTGRGPAWNPELTGIFTLRQGKVVYEEFFWDHAEALEAVGLSETVMPQDNLELVRKAQEAFNRRDLGTLAKLTHDELEFVSVLTAVDAGGGSHHGKEAWESYFARMDDSWEDWHIEDFRAFDAGDNRVASVFRLVGTGKSSGARVDRAIGLAYQLRDGKLWRMRSYLDPNEALEAVGLSK